MLVHLLKESSFNIKVSSILMFSMTTLLMIPTALGTQYKLGDRCDRFETKEHVSCGAAQYKTCIVEYKYNENIYPPETYCYPMQSLRTNEPGWEERARTVILKDFSEIMKDPEDLNGAPDWVTIGITKGINRRVDLAQYNVRTEYPPVGRPFQEICITFLIKADIPIKARNAKCGVEKYESCPVLVPDNDCINKLK